jgi:hypothetical protein
MPALKAIMSANALSCLVFGTLFLAMPRGVADFLGSPPAPALILTVLGAGLLLNGAHLVYAATRPAPARWVVAYFSVGDFLWVAGTLALVLTDTWITSSAGIAAALAVALGVGTFGFLQWRQRLGIASF